MSVTKTCAVCGTAFTPTSNNQRYCCKRCRTHEINARTADSRREWREAHREHLREYARAYYAKAMEDPAFRERQREKSARNHRRQYATDEAYRERRREMSRENYAANPEYHRAYAKAHRLRKANEARELEANVARVRDGAANRMERLRIGALVGTGRATAWDLAKRLRVDVADVLRMRDEWRRWRRDGVADVRAVRA